MVMLRVRRERGRRRVVALLRIGRRRRQRHLVADSLPRSPDGRGRKVCETCPAPALVEMLPRACQVLEGGRVRRRVRGNGVRVRCTGAAVRGGKGREGLCGRGACAVGLAGGGSGRRGDSAEFGDCLLLVVEWCLLRLLPAPWGGVDTGDGGAGCRRAEGHWHGRRDGPRGWWSWRCSSVLAPLLEGGDSCTNVDGLGLLLVGVGGCGVWGHAHRWWDGMRCLMRSASGGHVGSCRKSYLVWVSMEYVLRLAVHCSHCECNISL